MSEPGMLEEWCKRNGIYKEMFGCSPEDTVSQNIPSTPAPDDKYAKGVLKLIGSKDKVEYDIDYEGNLREVVASYNIDGKRYAVSLEINNYGLGRDHIRLEIKKRNNNPLKNLLNKNLLASSVTPVHVPAYERGCLWKYIKNGEVNYPSDERSKIFVDATIACLKDMTYEIEREKKKKSIIGYRDRWKEKYNSNRQTLLNDNLKEQEELKRRKGLDIINFLVSDSKRNKRK